MKKNIRSLQGFTLIELLVVVFIIGLSISLIAPDMYSLYKRSQAKNEIVNFQYLAQIGIEKSFFSEAELVFEFEDKTATLKQITEHALEATDPESHAIVKQIESDFFVFESSSFNINSGEWKGASTVKVKESDLKDISMIQLVDEP